MRTVFLATVFIALLCLTHAETFGKSKLRSQVKSMSASTLFTNMKKSTFGSTLLSMLSLRFKTSQGQLDTLLELLNQLGEGIEAQQQADDDAYAEGSNNLNGLIDSSNGVIEDATGNVLTLSNDLASNNLELTQANVQLAGDQQNQAQHEQWRQSLVDLRQGQADAFDSRVSSQNRVIQGLEDTISVLRSRQSDQNINQQGLADVIEVLEDLTTAFTASIAQDDAAESAAITEYTVLLNNADAALSALAADISELNVLIPQLNDAIAQLTDRLEAEEQRLETAQELLAQYQGLLQDLVDRYQSNSKTREDQLSLLEAVEAKLTQNPEAVQDVLRNA